MAKKRKGPLREWLSRKLRSSHTKPPVTLEGGESAQSFPSEEKSIIIDSVNFALGSRMPMDIVRNDKEYALCELVFSVDDATREELSTRDIMLTDDQVILQRRIINGKSSCKVNGETVTASAMREIAELLIDIHGQHEHQSLLYKKNHKRLLDSFCRDGLLIPESAIFVSVMKVQPPFWSASTAHRTAPSVNFRFLP